jgi:hypothetical protein
LLHGAIVLPVVLGQEEPFGAPGEDPRTEAGEGVEIALESPQLRAEAAPVLAPAVGDERTVLCSGEEPRDDLLREQDGERDREKNGHRVYSLESRRMVTGPSFTR